MTAVTDQDIAQVLAKLSLNYGRALDDEDAIVGLVDMWRTAIGGCALEDVTAGLQLILADETVKFFPPVAEFRARVLEANRRRHAAIREAAGHATVKCLTCLDWGWVDLGQADDGTFWVKACPNECVPPLVHHRTRPRAFTSGRRGPESAPQQLSLSPDAFQQAVKDTQRMLGERDDPLHPF